MKSYTDLEQSKVLAKILSLESADMEYLAIKENGELVGCVPFVKDDSEIEDSAYSYTYDRIACWSLSALLDYISANFRTDIKYLDNYWELDCRVHVEYAKELIDACYEMIIRLHELKML